MLDPQLKADCLTRNGQMPESYKTLLGFTKNGKYENSRNKIYKNLLLLKTDNITINLLEDKSGMSKSVMKKGSISTKSIFIHFQWMSIRMNH